MKANNSTNMHISLSGSIVSNANSNNYINSSVYNPLNILTATTTSKLLLK